ncbi:adenylate/guanylate cyclase domain-containing protein [Variovorax ureilyticus]|uniref:Adenylate/guanylate cyclase domain-containing protein n=1 Tax=Variovorax ureilyticus TaxID=1836198 RepID=A0ABU8VRB6_9BURK
MQNFCGECGAKLGTLGHPEVDSLCFGSYTPPLLAQQDLFTRFAVEGERKFLTVMFCDIANSTPLAIQAGAEAMHSLLDGFFNLALTEVHRVDGTMNQFLGDGFMALFGAPMAHEDHARRALTAALNIRERLRHATSEQLRTLQVRFGVHTGNVVVGIIGDKLRLDYTAIGDTTHLAARLEQHAEPNAINVSEVTQRAARSWFDFASLGRPALKGISESPEVFVLLGNRASPLPPGLESSLVGRRLELQALEKSLQQLRSGQGSVLIVSGEAGVGKSRLVSESRRGTGCELFVEGRSLSFGHKLSYWPFIAIMKAWFQIDDKDSEATALQKIEKSASDLFGNRAGEVIPYFATVLSLPMREEHEQRVRYLDARALGSQVLLCLRELFERQAKRAPRLIVMEDWHWVDNSSIALCEHLLPLARSAALSFWFVTRSEPSEPAARMRAAAVLQDGLPLYEVTLAPLTQSDSGFLIDNLLGATNLPVTVRSGILRRAEGNPFFIEEIVQSLIANGSLTREGDAGGWRVARPIDTTQLPDTVHDVIVARIDLLDESAKRVLNFAAVIGRSFFVRILRAIADSVSEVDSCLPRLELAELVRLRRQIPEPEYLFKHALVQEAAYESILIERRRTIHRRVARAIEVVFSDRLDEFTGLLAYHCALGEDWENARVYLMKAGDQAGRMAADAEALDYYRQAETVYLKVAGQELSPLQRATLDRKLGQALYGVGRYEEAVEHFSRALSNLGIAYPCTRAEIRLGTLKLLAAHFVPRLVGSVASQRRLNLSVAQEISTICQSLAWLDYFVDTERFGLDSLIELNAGERSEDVIGRVRGLGTLSVALMLFRAFGLARRRANEAVALADQSGAAAAKGGARFVRGWLDWLEGSPDLGHDSFVIAAEAYLSIGDLRRWGGPTYFMCWAALQRGEFSRAAGLAAELIRVGQDSGDPHVLSWGLTAQGVVGLAIGPLSDAMTCLAKARELCISISSFRQQAEAAGLMGSCLLREGRLDEAEVMILEAVGLIKSRRLRGQGSCDPLNAWAELRILQAERATTALIRRNAIRDAERACKMALRFSSGAIPWLSETTRLMADLAWIRGDSMAMHTHWNASLRIATELALPVQRARTVLGMGIRLAKGALIEEAIEVFAQSGANVDLRLAMDAKEALVQCARNSAT